MLILKSTRLYFTFISVAKPHLPIASLSMPWSQYLIVLIYEMSSKCLSTGFRKPLQSFFSILVILRTFESMMSTLLDSSFFRFFGPLFVLAVNSSRDP